MRQTPRVVLCLGLPGSASTWIFNVVTQMHGMPRRSLLTGYLDRSFDEFLQAIADSEAAIDTLIIKSHQADASLHRYVAEHRAPCILSVRDPRDCVVSLMERFDFAFDSALAAVAKSCHALLAFASLDVVLLRYEDRFFRSGQTISSLYRYLQLAEAVDQDKLLFLNGQSAVERFISTFDHFPPGRLARHGDDEYDKVSHWHRRHFGDGAVGKWRTRLNPEQIAIASESLADALLRFEYLADSSDGNDRRDRSDGSVRRVADSLSAHAAQSVAEGVAGSAGSDVPH